jgi:nucleotide-binding universal stress UspA family protein
MRKSILIAVDGSPNALSAVAYVALQCPASNTEVCLLSILHGENEEIFRQIPMDREFMDEMQRRYARYAADCRDEAERFLSRCKEVLVGAGIGEGCVFSLLRNSKEGVARDIIAEASRGYDAVVLGRRGLGRVESAFLGSVSNKIVQSVHELPVWIVGGEIRSRKILLAVDSSANACKAVEYAAPFLAASGAEIALCHVARGFFPILGPTRFEPEGELEERLNEKLEKQILEMFDSYRACLEKAGVGPEKIAGLYRIGSHGRAAEILEIAREGGYGAIVMGRRGIGAVHEFFLGRVTNKVLNGAKGVAVWIVP